MKYKFIAIAINDSDIFMSLKVCFILFFLKLSYYKNRFLENIDV